MTAGRSVPTAASDSRWQARRALLGLLLTALGPSGCYRVTYPAEHHCSAAEPKCPAGLVCNGQSCVRPDIDGGAVPLADGPARSDKAVASDHSSTADRDGPRPPDQHLAPHDLMAPDQVPCSSWTHWSCVTSGASCQNRQIICGVNRVAWLCGCQVDRLVSCGSAPLNRYANKCKAAQGFFNSGCCTP